MGCPDAVRAELLKVTGVLEVTYHPEPDLFSSALRVRSGQPGGHFCRGVRRRQKDGARISSGNRPNQRLT